jgi:hypothetical protein
MEGLVFIFPLNLVLDVAYRCFVLGKIVQGMVDILGTDVIDIGVNLVHSTKVQHLLGLRNTAQVKQRVVSPINDDNSNKEFMVN